MRFLIIPLVAFLAQSAMAQRPVIGILSYEDGLKQGRESCGLAYLKVNPYTASSPVDFPVPPNRVEPLNPGRPIIGILGGDDGLSRGEMECKQAMTELSLNPTAASACVMSLEIENSYPIGSAAGDSSASAAANTVKNCVSNQDIKTCFSNWVSCYLKGN
jgi:hypothetical protein